MMLIVMDSRIRGNDRKTRGNDKKTRGNDKTRQAAGALTLLYLIKPALSKLNKGGNLILAPVTMDKPKHRYSILIKYQRR